MLQPRLSWGGRGLRTTLWACLLSATATVAWAQTAAKDGPVLYFKQNQACLSAPNCQIPASPVFPNPNDYTTLATLTLPPGDYLVTSKLSAFAAGGTSYVNFECALLDLANPAPLDYSSFDGWAEQTLFLQTPLSIRAHRGGTVRIGCRAYGFQPDGVTLVDMHVWNVNIAALSVGQIKQGFQ
jgi:hypothetical protein